MTVILEGYIDKTKVAEENISNYTIKQVVALSKKLKKRGMSLMVKRFSCLNGCRGGGGEVNNNEAV